MTRSVLFLRAMPGRRGALLEGFRRLDVLGRASRQPGFQGAQLFVHLDGDDELLVTADWASPEAYQGWLDNPVRAEIQAELGPLLVEPPSSRVYELVTGVGSDGERS